MTVRPEAITIARITAFLAKMVAIKCGVNGGEWGKAMDALVDDMDDREAAEKLAKTTFGNDLIQNGLIKMLTLMPSSAKEMFNLKVSKRSMCLMCWNDVTTVSSLQTWPINFSKQFPQVFHLNSSPAKCNNCKGALSMIPKYDVGQYVILENTNPEKKYSHQNDIMINDYEYECCGEVIEKNGEYVVVEDTDYDHENVTVLLLVYRRK